MQVPGKDEKWNDTDYDIPKFSYPSAILIFGVTFLMTCFAIWVSNGEKIWIMLTLSITLAATTAYSRYFIDTKRKLCIGFWRLFFLLFLACVVVLYFVQF